MTSGAVPNGIAKKPINTQYVFRLRASKEHPPNACLQKAGKKNNKFIFFVKPAFEVSYLT